MGLVIKNVITVDPKAEKTEKKDLFINGSFICEEKDLEGSPVVIEAENLHACPALIDMHVHVFDGGLTPLGISADKVGVTQGVLTVADAGSTGIYNYPAFREQVIDKSETRVKFFLNIAKKGLCEGLTELADLTDLTSLEELLNFKKAHGEHMVGIKVRMSSSVLGGNGLKPLLHAREVSNGTGLPLMVHIGNAPPSLGEVLSVLKKGDIVTHCFHGKSGGLTDFKEEFQAAAERGVYFDVGHGMSSFSFKRVPEILEICDIDYAISTDIYTANFEAPVGSLMDTMSKFLPLGLSISEVVRKATALPAAMMNLAEDSLEVGSRANISLFTTGPAKTLIDSEGLEIRPDEPLKPFGLIKEGKVVWKSEL